MPDGGSQTRRGEDARLPQNPRYAILLGMVAILATVGSIGSWAFTAPIGSAVIVRGTVVVSSSRKQIQHLHGGQIRNILVREGERVKAGQILIALDPVQARARLSSARSAFIAELANEARLLAERDRRDAIAFPPELVRIDTRESRAVMAVQRRLFYARKAEVSGHTTLLRGRIVQIKDQIRGMHAQRVALRQQTGIIGKELKILQGLFKRGLTSQQRMLALQREAARLDGLTGQLAADLAKLKSAIGETNLQILQLQAKVRTDVLSRLKEVTANVADLREKYGAALDIVQRLIIRAPTDGIVVGLKAHTVGGVIKPGETLLEIVPTGDLLVVEARVQPIDIDELAPDQRAHIHFLAFSRRDAPLLNGRVVRISADALTDPQTRESYYTVRIAVPKSELARLGRLKVQAGMPVEAMIRTGDRTAAEYLFQPIKDSMRRAWREK